MPARVVEAEVAAMAADAVIRNRSFATTAPPSRPFGTIAAARPWCVRTAAALDIPPSDRRATIGITTMGDEACPPGQWQDALFSVHGTCAEEDPTA